MVEKRYYIRDRGKIRGPFDLAGLRALRDRGHFNSFHEISEDRQIWTTASQLTNLFAPSLRAELSNPASSPVTKIDAWHYVAGDGREFGPVLGHQILQLRRDGFLNDETPIWREGMADWMPLGSTQIGLTSDESQGFAPTGTMRKVWAPYGASDMGNVPQVPSSAGSVCSVLSVIFGSVAFLFCPPLFGLTGFVLGIVGTVLSENKTLGILGIVLSVLGALVGMIIGAMVALHFH